MKHRLRWVIQRNLGSKSDHLAMAAACESLGLQCDLVDAIPFSDELPDIPTDLPAIFYGSCNFVTKVYRSNLWSPGVFFDETSFTYAATLSHFRDAMLNREARITSLRDFAAEEHSPDTLFFIRPNQDLKEFAGQVSEFGEFRDWAKKLEEDDFLLRPETKIVVASPCTIDTEYRLFVVDQRVAACSRFRQGGKVESSPEVPASVVQFAEKLAARWSPARAFVFDIAETGGELSLVEINGMNSSGFYACDIAAIVREVSRIVVAAI